MRDIIRDVITCTVWHFWPSGLE